MITVAELARKALQLRLDPAPFVRGEANPTPAAQGYLTKVGKLLGERKDLRIKLCGKAVPRDGKTDETDKALASRRNESLKDLFANLYGIETDRMFLCEPEFDQNTEAVPRVELVLKRNCPSCIISVVGKSRPSQGWHA